MPPAPPTPAGPFLTPDPKLLATAVLDRRWTVLARTGVDLAGVATWDRHLDRRTRLLVPVDVQAYVVPKTGGELTVPVVGAPGDPAPFAEGAVRPPGVYLHWAMPDALLRGRGTRPTDGTTPALEFPPLPDRWVVVRATFPTGTPRAALRGWVLDAHTGGVTPLDQYSGTPAPAPLGVPTFDRVDAASGGGLLWTASYTASAGRFGFYDPLSDLSAGLDPGGAAYVVAGWWATLADDPLAGAAGRTQLDARLAELGWRVVHDTADNLQRREDPKVVALRQSLGLGSPPTEPAVTVTSPDGRTVARSTGSLAVQAALPTRAASHVYVGPALPRYATLVHGAVLGVPVTGTLPPGIDDRPTAPLALALGLDTDDVIAAFGAPALGTTAAHRQSAERLAAAFTSDLLDRLGSLDGLADLEEREHADGFTSLVGAPIPGARPDRLRAEDGAAANPTTVGRKGRAAARRAGKGPRPTTDKAGQVEVLGTQLGWKQGVDLRHGTGSKTTHARRTVEAEAEAGDPRPDAREITRPAPRWYRPQPPILAIRGAHPNHRHHGDGLFEADGRLRCRYPAQCAPAWDGVVDGATVVPTLGSGAVPAEVLLVVRESILLDPYVTGWLAAAGARGNAGRQNALATRLTGEMVRLYGTDGRYDGLTRLDTARSRAPADPWATVRGSTTRVDRELTAELARHSLLPGLPPSPVALTTWRQPWVPLWAEWQVTLEGTTSLAGWTLGELDLDPVATGGVTPQAHTFVGRTPLGQGVTTALHRNIERWLDAEQQRDATGASILSDPDEATLDRLGDFLAPFDLVSTALDGVREQLLGMRHVGQATLAPPDATGTERPLADRAPLPLFGGTLRVDALRLVDAFGRTLDVPVAAVATTTTLEVPGLPTGIRLRPRVQHLARWRWRFVDPAHPADADPAAAPEAFVDQLRPQLAVNPVAGFLLPDHIDEALEAFTVDGTPLGQLAHDALTGAVFWEPAPGRPLPPDAGPLAGLTAHDLPVGELAAGVVVAGVTARAVEDPPSASALSALLRAIDTTLWSVDTFAAVGSPTVAGLVGRPVAIVRATLRLELPDDLDEVALADPATAADRQAAFAALANERVPVRLGTLHRADDALLGFFVDDDYARVRLVDRVVAATARASGRHQGQLGLLGSDPIPPVDPLAHPFVVPDDTLWLRPGQTVRLTLLMLPAGRVHLTSGILPRKALALAHDWVGPGLSAMAPSIRVGPVLVDPAEIRLPLVSTLGSRQTFTRRTGPLTWRDDPIVAATQTALLPRLPHEAQEGWIRVTPAEADDEPEGAP